MKLCKTCRIEKPLSEFYFANKARTVYAVQCKICSVQRAKAWQKANPKRMLVHGRKYKYRLTEEELTALLEGQGSCCAICGKTEEEVGTLHLDHDHKTGRPRGFLCQSHNKGLGFFRDDVAMLEAAIQYLNATRVD